MKQIQVSAIRRKEWIIDMGHGVGNYTLNQSPDVMIKNMKKNYTGVNMKVIETKEDGWSRPSYKNANP